MSDLHPRLRSNPGVFPGAVFVGSADAGEVFIVDIVLRRRQDAPPLPSAEQIGAQPPRERKYLLQEDFEATYGADPKDVEEVCEYAAKFGLTVSTVSLSRRTVTVSGTAAQFSAALSITLSNYAYVGGMFRSYGTPLLLPSNLGHVVVGVLGLDTRPIAVPMAVGRPGVWDLTQVLRAQTVAQATAYDVFQKKGQAAFRNFEKASEHSDVRDFAGHYSAWCSTAAGKSTDDHRRAFTEDVAPAFAKAQQAAAEAVAACASDLNKASEDATRSAILAALDELDIKTPPGVAGLYGFPAGTDGSGQCVGIIELGGGYRDEDIASYFQFLGIPPPEVSHVAVLGGANAPGLNELYDGEVCLDIEVVGGAAPGAKIVCYFAPLTAQGFIGAIRTAIHDRVNCPSVLSISWALSEAFWLQTPMYLDLFEDVLKEAAVLGVTVISSAGDYGPSTLFHDGRAWVDYPASSPYVLGCGGTTLMSRQQVIYAEFVWNTARTFFQATGGGVSQVFPLPSWQSNAGVPPSVNPGGARGRGVPDLAANADPYTGYVVQVDGRTNVICGTSAGAPLWAALIARINQSLGFRVGYLNPYLYQKVNHNQSFHDIVSGNNGVYAAAPGWDPCSGWGTPNGAGLRDALGA
jgi:kumamolisin